MVSLPAASSRNAGYAYRDQLGPKHAGLTVLDYLASRYTHSSPAVWRARLGEGEIALDGRPAQPTDRLAAGQVLVWERPPWEEAAVPLCWALLHRDDHLLVVAKPAGLPTAPAGGFLAHTLLALVRHVFPEATPAHRLGRGTSGLVLFARTAEARAGLARGLREGAVRKLYRARVVGRPAEDAFVVDACIGRVSHPRLGTVHAAAPSGRPARSRVRVCVREGLSSLVEVQIDTGRPHQIRIHLAAAGHPLLGDPLYGPGGLPRPEAWALPGDPGYALHAFRLELRHPFSGEALAFACLPPLGLRLAGE